MAHLQGKHLNCYLSYNSSLFDAGQIENMLSHLEQILKGMAESGAEQRLSQVSMLTKEEQAYLTEGLNADRLPAPTASQLHRVFEAQAQAMADSVAVVMGDRSLSYQALNERDTGGVESGWSVSATGPQLSRKTTSAHGGRQRVRPGTGT
jgi:non-ribosomal peptide synthetase component F